MESNSRESVTKMSRRVIIITGANTGIGFEAAMELCNMGNDVILACRNEEKGKAAVDKILTGNPNALASFMQLDLADFSSIRQFVEEFHKSGRRLHVLVNNAAVYNTPQSADRHFTKDNFELTMGTNHLGHFLLTNLLLDDLKKSASEVGESRIVVVTSMKHDSHLTKIALPYLDPNDIFMSQPGSYNGEVAYKNSKLANILFTFELAKKLARTGVSVNAVSPGFIPSTELCRNNPRFLVKPCTFKVQSVQEGAATIVHMAIDEEIKGVSGKFFRNFIETASSTESKDEKLAQTLWELSARYCHLDCYEPLDAPPSPTDHRENGQ